MSGSPLLPVDEALSLILGRADAITEVEYVSLLEALGRVLAQDQNSSINVPPCDNSAMDGYAICFADLARQKSFVLSQRIAAGEVGKPLVPGTAARIFTGAPVPEGADTVVMQENVLVQGDQIILQEDNTRQGQNIRPLGQDIKQGSQILARGKCLTPQDVGLLSSIGVASIPVFRRLKVALLSTGDELIEPGQPLAEGQIYNSNRYMLMALLQAMGCEVVDGGIVTDNLTSTKDQLAALAEKADVIISSGGVSVGDEDHVKNAVESLGEISLWKLNIKPGKPVAFGSIGGASFCGLPGNPSSAFVTFCLLARPFILKRQGCAQWQPLAVQVPAGFELKKAGTRQSYLRARVEIKDTNTNDNRVVIKLYPNQSSGVLASASWANALVVIPPGKVVAQGDLLDVILLSELIH